MGFSSARSLTMIHADLGPELEAIVAELISSGRYESERAVLSEAVRLLQRREARWADFEASIVEAIEESDRGGGHAVDEVFDEILSELETRRRSS